MKTEPSDLVTYAIPHKPLSPPSTNTYKTIRSATANHTKTITTTTLTTKTTRTHHTLQPPSTPITTTTRFGGQQTFKRRSRRQLDLEMDSGWWGVTAPHETPPRASIVDLFRKYCSCATSHQ
ncbi:Hypothetical predicted protein [Olea europaea subsp. europaea]|uniref:Uncharacterized protein n=1 Tax=Olea europaea subsp. europaea TaxID=158383 RepID=A0A8S0SRT6_OLEEU|nr:Hypothetical predicted protein [Olea europaea subsp. europaea]